MISASSTVDAANSVDHFLTTFNRLNADNLSLLQSIYTEDVEFIDSFHRVIGRDRLETYFQVMYRRLISCEFDYLSVIERGDEASVEWVMHYRHQRVGGGKRIEVHGCSLLTFSEGRVMRHRDYFDAGEMIYHHLPLIGRVISAVRSKITES